MIRLEINNSDRTGDLERDSIRLNNQIQQRSDTLSFNIITGSAPTENQDVQLYKYDTIAAFAGVTVTLDGDFQSDVAYFYAGQKLKIRIGDADEATVEVATYTESTLTLTLVAAPSGTVSVGDKIGELIFGGVISRVTDRNVQVLDNIEYDIDCVDYTKIFDKKLIADTWTDVDSRYVINSFVNSTVNYNKTIDTIDYADNTAIQAEWIETGDGGNPTVDSSDFMEGDAAGVFPWTFAGGTATFTASPTAQDVSDFVDATSGTPTEGDLMLWIKTADYADITSFVVRIGSDATNYAALTFTLENTTDWQYIRAKFANASITGTPVWTAVDYVAVVIVQTANGTVRMNGLRINAENSFTMFNVESTPDFDDLRSPQLKPTAMMQLLAKTWEKVWFIDYERDIYFADFEAKPSPFTLTNTSNNFFDLKTETDTSQIGNRIIVRGGEKTSDSTYAQVFEGDGAKREWLAKTKFNNLVITIDNNTSTDTMEAGTTTTTVNATTHGLAVGDHIVQRSRSNVVREVLTVPTADQFTVEAVTGQASGDTFSKFSVAKTDGIEGLTDETTVDYVANSNEKSVRATASEATLNAAEFIRFAYNERVPIQIQYQDTASVTALQALGFGDGVFDLDPITDRNIQDIQTALAYAQAKVQEYSNAIVTGSFVTETHGLKAGQLLSITETISRSLNDTFVIQKIRWQRREGEFADNFAFDVTFGTTLFGWIEFMQKILAIKDKIELNVDDIVETFVTASEIVESADTNLTAKDGGFKSAKIAETVETNDTNVAVDFPKGSWKFEPNGAGQPLESRFNLCDFG